eukprot:GHVQ01042360.1.p1 GENE.GHVQ01042360.1~~GHVQ01042360.1.p1  ORF type:complete len:147 (-),score=35.25 GHVQ01042360.1:224-664(-)
MSVITNELASAPVCTYLRYYRTSDDTQHHTPHSKNNNQQQTLFPSANTQRHESGDEEDMWRDVKEGLSSQRRARVRTALYVPSLLQDFRRLSNMRTEDRVGQTEADLVEEIRRQVDLVEEELVDLLLPGDCQGIGWDTQRGTWWRR